jgi:hypothetical protein
VVLQEYLKAPGPTSKSTTVDKNARIIKKVIICVHVLRWEDNPVVCVVRRGIDSASLEAEEAEHKLYPCDQ